MKKWCGAPGNIRRIARNLVNLHAVAKGYLGRSVLSSITLGVSAGDRIGIVGRNGDGKSTLLRLIAGSEQADTGSVVHAADLQLGTLAQGDDLDPAHTIREALVGDRADHEWAANPRVRTVLDGLLGGVAMTRFPEGPATLVGPLSGGERRRIALARLLIDDPELVLLDEPTNHLDIEAVDWLASYLSGRRGSLVVITHDRWFLDAVCTNTWEVVDETVHQYEGGYAAYVLARAERDRQAAAMDHKRRQLIRKELAWLRRGPPARTSKPKFRIDAANALIDDEPDARNTVELLRFAQTRLGNKVIEIEDVAVAFGERAILRGATWRLGPGDRVGLVGVNGSGKTTLIRVLAGVLEPDGGSVAWGSTVRIGHLTQDVAELDQDVRVLESLEQVRQSATTSDGLQLSASQMCERFGFRGSRAGTFVRDLSGGERRRLQLMRLLMESPNVLILDEPTNDLDIETLTAMEDLLDSWPGTLVVVSHDRYFIERVCDNVWSLASSGAIDHLPGGIEQYMEARRAELTAQSAAASAPSAPTDRAATNDASAPARPTGGQIHAARKEAARLERAIDKLAQREAALHEQMAAAASDHEQLRLLDADLRALRSERESVEEAWMEALEVIEAAGA